MCLTDADLLLLGIDDEDGIRDMLHGLDAADVLLELLLLLLELCDFLLGKDIKSSVRSHGVDLVQALDTALDGLEVGQHAAEPSLVDIVHAASLGLSLDSILCLLLRADEENRAALLCDLEDSLVGLVHLDHRLLQVNDVDSVSLGEDVGRHLGVPATCLVTEMYACFQQFLHCYYAHG